MFYLGLCFTEFCYQTKTEPIFNVLNLNTGHMTFSFLCEHVNTHPHKALLVCSFYKQFFTVHKHFMNFSAIKMI